MIVHIAAANALSRWTRNAPAFAIVLADAFWPGPLTLILPRANGVSDLLTGGQDSIGLRVPAHPVAQALLARFVEIGGDGIAAPSANRFGRISATTAAHVADDFGSAVEVILDGGPCEHGIESTIVDCTRDQPSHPAARGDQRRPVGPRPGQSAGCIERRRPAGIRHAGSALRTADVVTPAASGRPPGRARKARPAGRTHRSARPLHYAAAGLRRHMVRRAAGQRAGMRISSTRTCVRWMPVKRTRSGSRRRRTVRIGPRSTIVCDAPRTGTEAATASAPAREYALEKRRDRGHELLLPVCHVMVGARNDDMAGAPVAG